jgi:transposase
METIKTEVSMKKIFFENAEALTVLVKQEISLNQWGRYAHRLHVILLLLSGRSAKETADIFQIPLRTVQDWAQKFKAKQLDGLKEEPRPGRKSRLSPAQLEQLAEELKQPTAPFGYNQGFWDGPLLQYHLQKNYQVKMTRRNCEKIFHRLGLSLKRPRPKMAGASPEAQEAFKKN